MKKLILSTAVVGALLFTACSSDDLGGTTSGDAMTFTVELPGMMSRAYSDGMTATSLTAYAYANGENVAKAPVKTEKATMEGGKATVTFNLINGHSYDIVFLATSPTNSGITYNTDARTFSVSYGTTGNNENLDAFYATLKGRIADGKAQNVELTRPFAQLNIGTDDVEEFLKTYNSEQAAGAEQKTAINSIKVSVENVYTTFDLMAGDVVADNKTNVELTAGPSTETFPAVGDDKTTSYSYLAMNYLLVPAKKDIFNIKMQVDGEQEQTYSNVPMQQNFRTNIYGSLLTAKNDYIVVINPGFEAPDNNVNILVSTPEELVEAVKKGGNVTLTQPLTIEKFELTDNKPVTVKLNGNELTLTGPTAVTANQSLTIKGDGTEKIQARSDFGFVASGNSEVNIEGVTINDDFSHDVDGETVNTLFKIQDGNNNVKLKNVIIQPNNIKCYAISTNASTPDKDVNDVITLENVTVRPTVIVACPVLFNTQCTINATNCNFYGCNSAIILRGGTYNFENCTFTQTLAFENNDDSKCTTTKADIKKTFRNLKRLEWDQGTNVPLAAVTMGNREKSEGTGGYQYATVVTMKGCTLNIPDVAKIADSNIAESIPAVYAYANQTDGLGVTFTYDAATKFNGAQEYDSGNITVNGQKITEPTYFYEVEKAQNELDLTKLVIGNYKMDITLSQKVDKIYLKDFSKEVSVFVKAGVDYPEFANRTTTGLNGGPSVLKNFTLEGDPASTKTCGQLSLYPMGSGTENVTIKNIKFDGSKIPADGNKNRAAIIDAGCVTNNLKVIGCEFTNMYAPAVYISKTVKQGNTTEKNVGPSESVTVQDCKVTIASDAPSTVSGLYLLQTKNVTVNNCTVTNAKYHGIFVRAFDSANITNNTVTNALHDGIKVETALNNPADGGNYTNEPNAEITITGNTVKAVENGIRVKSLVKFAKKASITGNTIDMSIAKEFAKGEPYGILLVNGTNDTTSPSLITVTNNTNSSNNEHFFFMKDFTAAEGSDYPGKQ